MEKYITNNRQKRFREKIPKYWSILQIYLVNNNRKTILSTVFAGVSGKVADIHQSLISETPIINRAVLMEIMKKICLHTQLKNRI